MTITNLKTFKRKTDKVKVLNGLIELELKSIDIEDIYEVLSLDSEEIKILGSKLDVTNSRTFLVTLLQESQTLVDKILSQCVVNIEDLNLIEDIIFKISVEEKLNLMISVFDLSWSSIESMLKQTKDVKGKIETILNFLKGFKVHSEGN